jgi:CheY-like chemotaxis protein
VLVVDGDADNRELYVVSFTLVGRQVTEASDGREALVRALAAPPTVIVTELRLPIIDGLSLCEILRRDRVTRRIPILVVTGETRATELARAQRAGADAVLIKPSTPDVVIVRHLGSLRRRHDPISSPALSTPAGRRKAHLNASLNTTDTCGAGDSADLSDLRAAPPVSGDVHRRCEPPPRALGLLRLREVRSLPVSISDA